MKEKIGTLTVSLVALHLKSNWVFAKNEPKLYVFNLLWKSGIKTEDFGERREESWLYKH